MSGPSPKPEDLGPLVSLHDVDNAPRRKLGRWVVAGSSFGLVLATILTRDLPLAEARRGVRLDDALFSLSMMAFGYGAAHLRRGLRGMPERFEVREGGLVHVLGRRTRTYPWDRIAFVRVLRMPATGPVGGYIGNTYRATVFRTRRQRAFAFNGLTHRGADIEAAILANCAAAPTLFTRTLRVLLVLYFVVLLATLVALIGSIAD